jgi:hypothetical protein
LIDVRIFLKVKSAPSMSCIPSAYFSTFIYLWYPNLHLRSQTTHMVLPYLAILTARHYLYVIQAL